MRTTVAVRLLGFVLVAAGCPAEGPAPVERVPFDIGDIPSPAVDLLFVVDNLGSMAQEQAILAASVLQLLTELTAPEDTNGDGFPDRPAVEDINVGVVSTDMGTGGYPMATCDVADGGDRGCLLHEPSATVSGCAPSYPAFLSRNSANAGSYYLTALAQDFTCIATLGTTGCGMEQQIAAARDAVTVNAAEGGCNEGFLRDAGVLAIIWVTDENDCTVPPENAHLFDPERTEFGHLNLRCWAHAEMITPVAQLAEEIRSAKPSGADSIVLGMVVGVPPEVPACTGSGAAMAACLDDPGMMEVVDPTMPSQLVPSCSTELGSAFPPRRLVELAQEFGDAAIVGSICRDDWSAVMTGVAERTAARAVVSSCLSGNARFNPVTGGDPADDCRAECLAVETLADDGPCMEDASCPAAWCPETTLEALLADRAGVCMEPGTSFACSPIERDLGLDDSGRRQCLVRQARREWGATDGDCSYVRETGWEYVPAVWSRREPKCPEVRFPAIAGRPLLAPSSRVVLYCEPEECEEASRCGPAYDPASLCCFPSQVCVGGGGVGQGTCCRPEKVCEGTCCGLLEECLPAYDSPSVRGCCPSERQCGGTCCRPGQYCVGGWMCTT